MKDYHKRRITLEKAIFFSDTHEPFLHGGGTQLGPIGISQLIRVGKEVHMGAGC